mgnify:CR=1 FL=1
MGAAIQHPRGAQSGPVSAPVFPSMADPAFASTSGAYGMFSGPVPVAAQVAGSTQQPAELALTGTSTRWGALAGASLIAAGAAMLLFARRRPTADA